MVTEGGIVLPVLPRSLSFPTQSQGCAVRSDSVHSVIYGKDSPSWRLLGSSGWLS